MVHVLYVSVKSFLQLQRLNFNTKGVTNPKSLVIRSYTKRIRKNGEKRYQFIGKMADKNTNGFDFWVKSAKVRFCRLNKRVWNTYQEDQCTSCTRMPSVGSRFCADAVFRYAKGKDSQNLAEGDASSEGSSESFLEQ